MSPSRRVYDVPVKTGALFLAAWLVALAGFVLMAILAASNDTFPADIWLAHRIQDVDIAAIDRALDWTEDGIDAPVVVLACAVAASLLLVARDGLGALLEITATAGRPLTTWAAKELIQRPRPSAELVEFHDQPSSFSFPSGHAESAMILYGLKFYFAALYISNLWLRSGIQAVCVWIVVAGGFERVYAGHHWPSDVLGGYYLGALMLSGIIIIHRLVIALRQTVTPPPSRSFSTATPAAGRGAGRRET